ncbi:MAG: TolC family protein [Terriglobales bacterium]
MRFKLRAKQTASKSAFHRIKTVLAVWLALLVPTFGLAQATSSSDTPSSLPTAPMPQQRTSPAVLSGPVAGAQNSTSAGNGAAPTPLSLKEAQALALKNNPLISVARLTALASQQVTRQVRSNLWPTASIDLTGVDSDPGSRISAGALNNPTVYPRAAAGASVSQLLTDFGRTKNLIASASLNAQAENQNAAATKEQILLAVDQAFYNALQSQAVLAVAQRTVADRQTVADQVGALYKNKLKSELDFSFASVNLAQAKLLLLDAQNNENAALATLSEVLGFRNLQSFQLIEDAEAVAPPPGNVDDLIATAFADRPEILSLQFQSESAKKFHSAERDLFFPDIHAMGVVGEAPVRDPVISSWYGAVGVDVNIPVFNGFLYSARAREAGLRAQAAEERVRDIENRVSRDVRTSWLNASNAYERLSVTRQLLEQSNLALKLAQARYKLGLSSIVELSQAQLQQTQAQITDAQAGYDYNLALAILQYQTKGL